MELEGHISHQYLVNAPDILGEEIREATNKTLIPVRFHSVYKKTKARHACASRLDDACICAL